MHEILVPVLGGEQLGSCAVGLRNLQMQSLASNFDKSSSCVTKRRRRIEYTYLTVMCNNTFVITAGLHEESWRKTTEIPG